MKRRYPLLVRKKVEQLEHVAATRRRHHGRSQQSSKAEAPPHRLVTAAAAELVETGGRLEMASVAARAGVSVGLSYHYFGSKAGLIAAVVEDFYNRYDAEVIDLNPLPGHDWAARERRRVELMVDFYLREPLAPLVLARLSAEPEVAAVDAQRIARHIKLAARNVEGARRKGHLPAGPDAGLLVGMIMGGLRQAVGQVLAGYVPRDRDRLVEDLWGFVASAAGLGMQSK